MKPIKLLALAATAVLLAPAFAMAATLDVSAAGSTGVGVGSGSSAGANTGVNVTTGVNANVGASGSANSGTSGSADTNTDMNGSSAGSMQGSDDSGSMSGMDANGMLMITAQDAANASDQGAASVTSSSAVSSDSDFAAYARDTLRSDANIKEVDADDASVAVKYQEPGHFLGLFPVTMNATAKIAADGNVTFSYPWYRFLTTTSANDTALRTALSAQAAQALDQSPSQASEGATSTVAASGNLSASEKAKLLDSMRVVLDNAFNTSATASGSAAGSGSASY